MTTRRIGRGAVLAAVLGSVTVPAIASAGPSGGALPPALVQVLDVHSLPDVPDDVDMVAVNITATRAAGKGYFTAYACDEGVPDASNVNYPADEAVPNLALVSTSAEGTICIATSEISDLVVDVIGYVPAGSDIRALAAPYRITDTRPDDVPAAGDTFRVPVTGPDGPFDPSTWPDVGLVLANVTAISRGGQGYLSVTPCASGDPSTSSVNFGPGQTKANFVVSRLSDAGDLCVFTSEPADVIVDIAAVAGTGITTLPEPLRVVDTRDDGVPVSTRLDLDVVVLGGLPPTATAAVYNLTAARSSGRGFATSHPCLTTTPTASNLNFEPGPPVANGAITKLSGAGRLCVDVSTPTDLIVDLIGYTAGIADYVPINPTRVADSRQGWQPWCDRSLLYVAGRTEPWFLWDPSTRALTHLPLPNWASADSPDGRVVYVGEDIRLSPRCDVAVMLRPLASGLREAWVADVAAGTRRRLDIPTGGTFGADLVGVDVDGRILASWTQDDRLEVFDLETLEVIVLGVGASSSTNAVQMDRTGTRFAVNFFRQPTGATEPTGYTATYDLDGTNVTSEAAIAWRSDSPPMMSPDGNYLAWQLPARVTAVTSVYGDEVARYDETLLRSWAGSGTLFVDDVVPLVGAITPGAVTSVPSLLPMFGSSEPLDLPTWQEARDLGISGFEVVRTQ